MLQAIERYMKQAIVDKVSSVSSSALVSSLHMMKISYDVVKRWINEAQEAASSDNIMVQYHALGVLYHLRKNDRLAVSKMLNKFTKSGLKSQFAYCMLIRIASRLLKETEDGVEKVDKMCKWVKFNPVSKREYAKYEKRKLQKQGLKKYGKGKTVLNQGQCLGPAGPLEEQKTFPRKKS
ncbi:Coatomer subunit gamma-2 [Saguinus oedipus]|uniref:Coatomer subunit gamma-2 n=1 Tax=Saguinus oedipus TaxID=9490 RepID=A0ABQ9UHV4_SAGOE|nr:Coatomer subunit gamma-2 [Saguinus oedipus]